MRSGPRHSPRPDQWLLGIDGGATRTVALLADARLNVLRRIEAGPGNVRLLSPLQLRRLFKSLDVSPRGLASIAIGLAGARTQSDRTRIREAAEATWPGIRTLATNDLETALAAAEPLHDPQVSAQILVLSGTGSCCFGRRSDGYTAKVGGWGHWLGDEGSSYDLGLQAVRAVLTHADATGQWSRLGARLLRKIQLDQPDDFITWIQHAEKDDVAALAVEVFAAARAHDSMARSVLLQGAEKLAGYALRCARRLANPRRPIHFVLAGGTLLNQPRYAAEVARRIRIGWPSAKLSRLRREGAWGALCLAAASLKPTTKVRPLRSIATAASPLAAIQSSVPSDPTAVEINRDRRSRSGPPPLPPLAQSPTEQRNPRSLRLHRLSLDHAVRLFLSEDRRIPEALLAQRAVLAKACRLIARQLQTGGRLFYVGAGSSGRLGVLDAAECPPTFRTPPDLVQGIMAGGPRALWESIEGAEDDAAAGARDLDLRRVTRRDVVVGIAASGRTPFVWGALRAAHHRRASTILLCFNPALRHLREGPPDIVIAPDLGPELLTGSTRLKCGTATKIVLNLFTTLTMVRLGKVVSNLMIDLNPSNAKLRDRAVRIVQDLTRTSDDSARRALERSHWNVKRALASLNRGG